jgi:thiopurine S-methyltransferase
MDPDFWLERWRNAQIGFHQPRPNAKLAAYWPRLALSPGATVFVPLCGKSLDMAWLAQRGHRVIGIELSEAALDAFFASQHLTPDTRSEGPLTVKAAGPYELWCGDFFAMHPDLVATATAVYDRAALVALPPAMRRDYARHLLSLFPAPPPALLITLEYDQSRADGPPHSVPRAEIDDLFAAAYHIDECHRALDEAPPPKFIEAGVPQVHEIAYLLRPLSADGKAE